MLDIRVYIRGEIVNEILEPIEEALRSVRKSMVIKGRERI